jgi:regulator of sigma E protease
MEGEEEESYSERSFSNKPVWVRASVIAAGPLANLLLAFLIICIVYSATGYSTRTIDRIQEGSAADNAGIMEGDTVIGYNGKRIYDPMEVIQFLYISKGEPATIAVKRKGVKEPIEMDIEPTVYKEYLLGFYADDALGKSNVVADLAMGGPAEKAGMQVGDRITALNGTEVTSIEEIKAFLKENKEASVDVTVDRQGNEQVLKVTPKLTENYYLGIEFSSVEKGSLLGIMSSAAGFTYSNIRMVPYSLYWLVTGQVSVTEMTGPVGIVSTMNNVAQKSETFMEALLQILLWTGLISAAIGATNLVPFPALDGSKLLILAIEAISRKKIPVEKEAIITTIGFFILIGFSIFVMANDIMRFIIK